MNQDRLPAAKGHVVTEKTAAAGTPDSLPADIRLMEVGDCAGAAEIETLSFSDPWKEETFREFLESRLDTCLGAWERESGRLAGYAVLRQIAGEGELLRIAVDPDFRGRKIGRKLLAAVTDAARKDGTKVLYLEVRAGNESAVNLYRSAGFQETGRRKAYYRHPTEDALLMELRPV